MKLGFCKGEVPVKYVHVASSAWVEGGVVYCCKNQF